MRKARDHPNMMVCHGRAYRAVYNPETGLFTLDHYGTEIVRVNTFTGAYEVGAGAFSASDRDAINSVFYYTGITEKAHIKNGEFLVD